MEEKMEGLKAKAERAAKHHGHKLLPWKTHRETTQYTTCVHCGASVSVHPVPFPNEVDIGGNAVAVGCTPRVVVMFAWVYDRWVQQGPPCGVEEFLEAQELDEARKEEILLSDVSDQIEWNLGAGGTRRILILTEGSLS